MSRIKLSITKEAVCVKYINYLYVSRYLNSYSRSIRLSYVNIEQPFGLFGQLLRRTIDSFERNSSPVSQDLVFEVLKESTVNYVMTSSCVNTDLVFLSVRCSCDVKLYM